MNESDALWSFHEKHVRGSFKESIVETATLHLCNLSQAVYKSGLFNTISVYITTRSVKHMYDKRPAEEFDAVLSNLIETIRFPDTIYTNKDSSKRADLYLLKTIDNQVFFYPVEAKVETEGVKNYVVTGFRLPKPESYLKNYNPVWNWGSDNSHRTDLDAPVA